MLLWLYITTAHPHQHLILLRTHAREKVDRANLHLPPSFVLCSSYVIYTLPYLRWCGRNLHAVMERYGGFLIASEPNSDALGIASTVNHLLLSYRAGSNSRPD